jgi:hypothetical protein
MYSNFVRRSVEATAPGGEERGSCPDFAAYTLAFALQQMKNERKTSVRVIDVLRHSPTELLHQLPHTAVLRSEKV